MVLGPMLEVDQGCLVRRKYFLECYIKDAAIKGTVPPYYITILPKLCHSINLHQLYTPNQNSSNASLKAQFQRLSNKLLHSNMDPRLGKIFQKI